MDVCVPRTIIVTFLPLERADNGISKALFPIFKKFQHMLRMAELTGEKG